MAERDPYSRVEYRRLIAWPERIRREWPLLEEVLGSGPSRQVLELGCGPGEHARALADAGYHVVAVDRSPDMLAQAAEQPIPANLRFVEGDIAQVDRLVEESFGGALCLGNTLPHLATDQELASFAAALARALEPGAPLLVQVLNYDRIHDQGVRALPVNVRPHEEGELVFLRLMTSLPDGRVRTPPSLPTASLCSGRPRRRAYGTCGSRLPPTPRPGVPARPQGGWVGQGAPPPESSRSKKVGSFVQILARLGV